MAELFWLSDAQWERIRRYLPEYKRDIRRADDPAIVHTWNATGIGGKMGFDTGEMFLRKPEKIATGLGHGWTFPDKSMP